MECQHEGCSKQSEEGKFQCFRHRVLGIGFKFQGGAIRGKSGWHTSKNDWLREHMSVDSEKELLKRDDVGRA